MYIDIYTCLCISYIFSLCSHAPPVLCHTLSLYDRCAYLCSSPSMFSDVTTTSCVVHRLN